MEEELLGQRPPPRLRAATGELFVLPGELSTKDET